MVVRVSYKYLKISGGMVEQQSLLHLCSLKQNDY
jgi:hypothetical protein